MSTATELASEINHASEYIRQQRDMQIPGFDLEASMHSLAEAMVVRINRLPRLTAEMAGILTGTLRTSAYSNAGKAAIATAISVQMSACPADNTTMFQTLTCTNKIFTQDDINKITDCTMQLQDRVSVAVRRMSLLRIRHPSDETIRYLAAFLGLTAFANYPSYASMYALQADLKSQIRSSLGPADAGIRRYPDSPDALPRHVFVTAYPAGDGLPIVFPCDRLANTARNHVPMRNTSKLLRDSSQQPNNSTSQVVVASQLQVQQQMQQQMQHQFQQSMSGLMSQLGQVFGLRPPMQFHNDGGSLQAPPNEDTQEQFSARLQNAFRRGPRALAAGSHHQAQQADGHPQGFVWQPPSGDVKLPPSAGPHTPSSSGSHESPEQGSQRRSASALPGFETPVQSRSHDDLGVPNDNIGASSPRTKPMDVPPASGGAAFVGRSITPKPLAAEDVSTTQSHEPFAGALAAASTPTARRVYGKRSAPSSLLALEATLERSMAGRDAARAIQRKNNEVIKKAAEKAAKEAVLTCKRGIYPTGIAPAAETAAPATSATPVKLERGSSSAMHAKPSFSCEHSRSQCICRTGIPGTKTIKITYEEAGGRDAAMAMAELWVVDEKKKRGML